ncbi:MAG: hypothetical protein K2Q09_04790, partial [Phycisphaerales bacterium]|nr:hypothetical protein [Phycisphaerales bacterium]
MHKQQLGWTAVGVALAFAGCAGAGGPDGSGSAARIPEAHALGGGAVLANPATPGLIQYPALSPDGSTIVFNWLGDLWAVPSRGGVATRLTSSPADDRHANFSPDGSMIAFESDRDGGRSIYVMQVGRAPGEAGGLVTGPVRRLTISDKPQELAGGGGAWLPDGSAVLLTERNSGIFRGYRMYKAPASGGPVAPLTEAYGSAPRASGDGGRVVFTRRRAEYTRPR